MAATYAKPAKSSMDHAYDDARDAARAEVRRISRRVTDLLYVEIDNEFRRALLAGEEISVRPDMELIKAAALPIITKQLTR